MNDPHADFPRRPLTTDELLLKFCSVKPYGPDKWQARCPAHDDHGPSLTITETSDKYLLYCHSGCKIDSILSAVGLTSHQLFKTQRPPKYDAPVTDRREVEYNYCNADGKILYQVVRYPGKKFSQRRPDERDGWIWNLDGVERVLYRLPEVIRAVAAGQRIFCVEGEKDAESLTRLGLTATTSPGGAGKWKPSYTDTLKGADVVIIPDNDEPGRNHADQVARSLHGKARSVKFLNLPGLPEHGDVSDWLNQGGTADQLNRLANDAPLYDPAPTAPPLDEPQSAGSISVDDFEYEHFPEGEGKEYPARLLRVGRTRPWNTDKKTGKDIPTMAMYFDTLTPGRRRQFSFPMELRPGKRPDGRPSHFKETFHFIRRASGMPRGTKIELATPEDWHQWIMKHGGDLIFRVRLMHSVSKSGASYTRVACIVDAHKRRTTKPKNGRQLGIRDKKIALRKNISKTK